MGVGDDPEPPAPAWEPAAVQLRLLDGFALLRDDALLELQPKAQQLLAFLALRERPVPRALVASTLWAETSEQRAQARLRSTLWRLRQSGCLVVERDHGRLHLAAGTAVDVRRAVAQARRLLTPGGTLEPGDEDTATLRGELLPGWVEEWVLIERERLRQLQLHALERLGERLAAAGRVADGLDAALSAVSAEPLRESAQRLVIAIHLSEGNQSEALRQYRSYCQLLADELGVQPSPHMARLVGDGRLEAAARLVTSR